MQKILTEEVCKYTTQALEQAQRFNSNGLLIYVPIKDDYTEKPRIAVANPRDEFFLQKGGIHIRCETVNVMNFDGSGTQNIECYTLPIQCFIDKSIKNVKTNLSITEILERVDILCR